MACAFEGERVGAGSAHGDNIAPAVYGGFVLVRVAEPAGRRPAAGAGRTDRGRRSPGSRDRNRAGARAARHAPSRWPTRSGSGRTSARSSTRCIARDFDLLSRSLEDTIAEPRRAPLVPGLAADQAGGDRRRRARLQPVRFRAVAVRAVPRRRDRRARRRGDDARRSHAHRRRAADLRLADRAAGRARGVVIA